MAPYDLCFVVDATGSMSDYLAGLRGCLGQVSHLSSVTGLFDHVAVLVYRDYSDSVNVTFSGWHHVDDDHRELDKFVTDLKADGGGDAPEASKTALYRLLQEVQRPGGKHTIAIWYTDAPPHHPYTGGANHKAEVAYLEKQGASADWMRLCADASAVGNPKGPPQRASSADERSCTVHALLNTSVPTTAAFYVLLSQATGGVTMYLQGSTAVAIANATINLIMALAGEAHTFDHVSCLGFSDVKACVAALNNPSITEAGAAGHLPGAKANSGGVVRPLLTEPPDVAPAALRRQDDMVSRLDADPAYRTLVYDVFGAMATPGYALAITHNPVFGRLWRGVCRDRTDPRRDVAVAAMSAAVPGMAPADRERMQAFLNESYLRFDEVTAIIEAAATAATSPTTTPAAAARATQVVPLADSTPSDDGENAAADAAHAPAVAPADASTATTAGARDTRWVVLDVGVDVAHMKPGDLLEVSRSCSPAVLQRLAAILAGLRVVDERPAAPATLSAKGGASALPLALTHAQLFKLLPHLAIPGLMFSARPAAVLAMIALVGAGGAAQGAGCGAAAAAAAGRLADDATGGLAPAAPQMRSLADRAALHLRNVRGTWIDAALPENYTVGFVCLVRRAHAVLLSRQQQQGRNVPPADGCGVLTSAEAVQYEALGRLAGLQANALTDIHLALGYTSRLTRRPDVKIACKQCHVPVSTTAVDDHGVCGLCIHDLGPVPSAPSGQDAAEQYARTGMWCECSQRDCRAHYVVLRPELLKVRPKCHFCRAASVAGTAPTVTCCRCTNRIVDAAGTFAAEAAAGMYLCPACTAEDVPLQAVAVPLKTLVLAQPHLVADLVDTALLADVFDGHSLFKARHTLKTPGAAANTTAAAPPLVAAAPSAAGTPSGGAVVADTPAAWSWEGKRVLNCAAVAAEIDSWVRGADGRTREHGVCGVCFGDDFLKQRLVRVCGRSNCRAVACKECLDRWYGAVLPGRAVPQAHLYCPYCKQLPAAKVLRRHNPRLLAVRVGTAGGTAGGPGGGDLDPAWHHAWCGRCDGLFPCAERACLADGELAAQVLERVQDFQCELCRQRQQQEAATAAAAAAGGGVARPSVGGERQAEKECPHCGTMVHKESGCDHITCDCGGHWCWACRRGFGSAEDTYAHMGEAHGGFYNGGDYEDDDGDDDGLWG